MHRDSIIKTFDSKFEIYMNTTFETLKQEIIEQANRRIETAEHDYKQAMNDCKNGIYDKWFRYHRTDDGRAYDMGWMEQNKTTMVERVQFI